MFSFTAEIPRDRVWYVVDFGAVGDGKTVNTKALQSAIDTCHAVGGGTVRFTPGTFLSGSLFLKDNVTLNLDAGAVLLGSPNKEDYTAIQRVRNQLGFSFKENCFLLYAENAKNIAIEGRGEISGSGDSFWLEQLQSAVRKPKEWRPRALICFTLSKQITLRDISLTDSPTFTFWAIGCEGINVDGVRIVNPQKGPNTDGLDLDCCRHVTVNNCIIEGGDDAIAIKSDSGILGGEDMPCEDIVVTNCVLQSGPACGIRIGYEGDSVIRNCTFSNLTIRDTDIGLDMISILPHGFESILTRGTRIENILFENISMRNVRQALHFWMGNECPDKKPTLLLRDVRVTNVIAECRTGSVIGRFTDVGQFENISLSNVTLIPTEKLPEGLPPSGAGVWGTTNPYALYVSNIDGIQIDNLFVDFRKSGGFWHHAVFCENVDNVSISGLSTRSFAAMSSVSQIGLKNTAAFVNASSGETGTVFIHAENSRIKLGINDIENSKQKVNADADSKIVLPVTNFD